MPKESMKEIEYWWQTAEENYQNLVKFKRSNSHVDKRFHDEYMMDFMDENNVFAFKDVLSNFFQKKTEDAQRPQPRSNKFAPELDRLLTSIALRFRKVSVREQQKVDNEKMRSRKSPYSTEYFQRQQKLLAKRHDDLSKEILGEPELSIAQHDQILADRQQLQDSNHHKMKIANKAVGFVNSISKIQKETKTYTKNQTPPDQDPCKLSQSSAGGGRTSRNIFERGLESMKAIHKLSLNKMDTIIQDYVSGMSFKRKKTVFVKKTHCLKDNAGGYGESGTQLNFTRQTTESVFYPDGH